MKRKTNQTNYISLSFDKDFLAKLFFKNLTPTIIKTSSTTALTIIYDKTTNNKQNQNQKQVK